MKTLSKLILSMLLIFSISSCKESDSSSKELELVEIHKTSQDKYSISLKALNPLETGYNRLFWSLSENGKSVKIDSLQIAPLMRMATMNHACPFQKPFESSDVTSTFEGYVVFIMPSGEMGTWEISTTLYLKNGDVIETTVPIQVGNSWRLQSTTLNDTKYFISWVQPTQAFVGKNTVQILLHKKQTMMNFPSSNDVNLEIYPYMDMGGGEGHSAPFDQLISKGNGFFEGSISYSMSGDWTVTVTLKDGTTTKDVIFSMNVISK